VIDNLWLFEILVLQACTLLAPKHSQTGEASSNIKRETQNIYSY